VVAARLGIQRIGAWHKDVPGLREPSGGDGGEWSFRPISHHAIATGRDGFALALSFVLAPGRGPSHAHGGLL